ncbi:MAG: hypothetical protein WHS77_06020 [Brevinematales bacterium]
MNNRATEKHPFNTFIQPDSQVLIVGSFPPIKFTEKIYENIQTANMSEYYKAYENNRQNLFTNEDISFYYGSRDNLFWKILTKVFNQNLTDKDSIIKFLCAYKFGITDIVEEASRKIRSNKLSSLDADLIIIKPRNIPEIISSTKIKFILTTSEFVTNYLANQFCSIANKPYIQTLLSPSKSASRAIGRLSEYKNLKSSNKIKNTIDYRVMKYNEIFKSLVAKIR